MPTQLKVNRIKQDLTQEDAAKHLGISRSLYCLIENGRYDPSSEVKAKLIQIYNKPISKLLKEV